MRHSKIFSKRRLGAATLATSALLAYAAVPVAAASRARAAATPGCSASNLVIWLNTNGNGAAGSIVYNLEFTNLSAHACSLTGFPGVSAISLRGHHQLGKAASRSHAIKVRSIRLASGTSAIAMLKITQVGNFPPSSCHPVNAAGLRVFAPNTKRSKTIPFPFRACSNSGPGYLNVRAVQKS